MKQFIPRFYDFINEQSNDEILANKEYSTEIGNQIVEIAKRYTGLVETTNNKKWGKIQYGEKIEIIDQTSFVTEFLSKNSKYGITWQPGWHYCSCFASSAFIDAHKNLNLNELGLKAFKELTQIKQKESVKIFWNSLLKTEYAKQFISYVPVKGSIGFINGQKLGDINHVFLVEKIYSKVPGFNVIKSIEGNYPVYVVLDDNDNTKIVSLLNSNVFGSDDLDYREIVNAQNSNQIKNIKGKISFTYNGKKITGTIALTNEKGHAYFDGINSIIRSQKENWVGFLLPFDTPVEQIQHINSLEIGSANKLKDFQPM